MFVLEYGFKVFTDEGKLGTAFQVGFTESSVDDGSLVSGVGTDEENGIGLFDVLYSSIE